MKDISNNEILSIYSLKSELETDRNMLLKELEYATDHNRIVIKELIRYKEIEIQIMQDFIDIHKF